LKLQQLSRVETVIMLLLLLLLMMMMMKSRVETVT